MTVAATNMPPTGRDRHGKTPCAQGARRDPQSARSNVTASQPEKDSSAEVFCRATPVLCAPPTATSIGAHQPREEDPPPLRGQSGDVQAERGARREPTSARSNMTASGPEQDLVAGTSRRAPRDRRKVDHCNRRHAPIPGGSAAPACPRGCGSGRDGTKNSRK